MATRDWNQTDKTLGIVIMVFSAVCGICPGLAAFGLGGALGALGGAAASTAGGSEGAAGAAAAAVGGGMIMVIGVGAMLSGGLGLAGGYGMMKALKWGFTLVLVSSIINLLVNLASMIGGNFLAIIGLGVSGFIAYYCYQRLQGKWGEKPV